MGAIRTAANAAFRDYVVDGNPPTGANKPDKSAIRTLFGTVEDTISAGGGSSGSIGSAEIAYQDFSHVADNTLLNGFVLSTGQTLTTQGVAGPTVKVVNPTGTDGYVEATDIFYAVLNFPHKNFIAYMDVVWSSAGLSTDGIAMGCGRYIGGLIISKMAHAQWDFDLPYFELWGSDHNSSGLSYLVQDDIVDKNSNNNLAKTSAKDTIIRCTVVVVDNTAMMHYNNGQITGQFYYAGAGSGVGNGSISDQVGDYIYYETTGNSGNPKIRAIYARELTEEECLAIMLPPMPPPPSKLMPRIFSGFIPFATATEIFRFAPGNSTAGTSFKIKLSVFTGGSVAGYCQHISEWWVTGHQFAGTMNANAFGPDLGHLSSENGSVISLSGAITAVISGTNVLVKVAITRTGSDATAYSPFYEAHVEQYGDLASI